MKNKLSFIIGGVAGVIILLALFSVGAEKRDAVSRSSLPTDSNSAARALETQTKSEAQVEISATPSYENTRVSFALALETHSVELKEALDEVSILIDELGREYRPLSWEGDPPGGHHRSGTLLFGDIEPSARSLTLVIRGIGGVPERKFTWTIE